jgi:mono/diheme cytochrome c family protein
MFKYLFTITALVGLWGLQSGLSDRAATLIVVDESAYVEDVLASLGKPKRGDNSARPPVTGASAEMGERIVTVGIGTDDKRQSKHFVCTSCHNTVPEDPDLTISDPEARLTFTSERGLPFLPGTTLYGAINRESYYNDDYEKKYGDLVLPARRDLRAAIQLCATECAQGNALSGLEMESVIRYLSKIGLKLSDLDLSKEDLAKINRSLSSKKNQESTITLIQGKFLAASPAHFVFPPKDRKAGFPVEAGRPDRGALIYQNACLHCHENKRYSFFNMAEDSYSYDYLLKHFPRYSRYSTYQVVRYGTSPIPGKKAYMPHYTAERMSDRQVEDLRAYLALKSSK